VEGDLSARSHRAGHGDISGRSEFSHRENAKLVVFLEREITDHATGCVRQARVKLHTCRIRIETRDENLAEICVGLHTTRRANCLRDSHSRCESDRARLPDVALDGDAIANALGDGEHANDVACSHGNVARTATRE